jgi:hypothetical protein
LLSSHGKISLQANNYESLESAVIAELMKKNVLVREIDTEYIGS